MPDFNVRSDSVNVEQIMEQIRARINEKRGVDYTEEQLREIAAVKLEKFLDPRGVRSDLLERFKHRDPLPLDPIKLPLYPFEDSTIYETHRGPLGFIRRLLNPILKLFFNPNALIHAIHSQTKINELLVERDALRERQRKERREMDALYYELIHNLVFEMTRVGIENKNLKMRVESIASRLEFNERRARALESVVSYKRDNESRSEAPAPAPQYVQRQPYQQQPRPQPQQQPMIQPPAATTSTGPAASGETAAAPSQGGAPSPGGGNQPGQPETPGQRSRRRRRRRGRRGGGTASALFGGGQPQQGGGQPAPQAGQPEGSAGPAPTSPSAGPDATHDHVQADRADSHEHESDGPDTDNDTDPQ